MTSAPPRFEQSLARVVDVRTGSERSRLEKTRQNWVWLADEELVVLQGDDGYHAYERDGRLRWSVLERGIYFATRTERLVLTPEVGRRGLPPAEARLLRIDRATGEVATLRRGPFARVAPVIARDVFHAVERQSPAPVIAAFTLEGKPLWRLELGELEGLSVNSLAVLHGGIVGVTHGEGGRVFRIVGDP